jgi:hypothetical protein
LQPKAGDHPRISGNPTRGALTMQTLIAGAVIIAVVAGLIWILSGTPSLRQSTQELVVPVRSSAGDPTPEPRTLEIITVLARDAIPAIMNPNFVSGEKAHAQMQPHSQVIGLSINGDYRAYSTAHLNSHEVVNDTVGGVPVAVTW